MPPPPAVERWCAEIRNGAYMVRAARRPAQRLQRAQAIIRLGATVRAAFAACADHEKLLAAIVEGLRPDDYRPPF